MDNGGESMADHELARANDSQWEEHVLTRVDGDAENGWIIYHDHYAFCVSAEHGVEPKAGDVARFYGKGFGFPVLGLDLNGVNLFYETADEYRERVSRERQEQDAKKRREWGRRRDKMDERLSALPKVFQMRVCRFRHHNPDFGWEYEDYEMAACVDAVRIAESLGGPEKVEAFHKLSWKEQVLSIPDLDEGHSGNTFGMAVRLAHHYMTDPDLVWMEHAAIAPLVGCGCGCPPVQDEDAERVIYQTLARQLAPGGQQGET